MIKYLIAKGKAELSETFMWSILFHTRIARIDINLGRVYFMKIKGRMSCISSNTLSFYVYYLLAPKIPNDSDKSQFLKCARWKKSRWKIRGIEGIFGQKEQIWSAKWNSSRTHWRHSKQLHLFSKCLYRFGMELFTLTSDWVSLIFLQQIIFTVS